MAETLNDLKWQLKVAKATAGRKDMSITKKNEWKRKARTLQKRVDRLEKREKLRQKHKR